MKKLYYSIVIVLLMMMVGCREAAVSPIIPVADTTKTPVPDPSKDSLDVPQPTSGKYFPLAVGNVWEYDCYRENPFPDSLSYTMSIISTTSGSGNGLGYDIFDGTETCIDMNGDYSINNFSAFFDSDKLISNYNMEMLAFGYQEKAMEIKLPYPLEVGKKWQNEELNGTSWFYEATSKFDTVINKYELKNCIRISGFSKKNNQITNNVDYILAENIGFISKRFTNINSNSCSMTLRWFKTNTKEIDLTK